MTFSKEAFGNWYFEYCEAEREFLDARRIFEVKRRDICLFLIRVYAEWCRNRFGAVLRPAQSNITGSDFERTVALFFDEFEIPSRFRDVVTRLLNQAFDERFGGVSTNE